MGARVRCPPHVELPPFLLFSPPPGAAVAKAVPSGPALEGTNVAIAVFLPVLVVALLIAGVYLYFSK